MNDTSLIDRLRELPPELRDPVDRFEQVQARVSRRRRQRAAGILVGAAAVLALAVPLAAQFLPRADELSVGSEVFSVVTDASTADADEVLPGSTQVTQLSWPRTTTQTGNAAIDLGPAPDGATAVTFEFSCLSPGTFLIHPDGGPVICTEDDVATTYAVVLHVIDLATVDGRIAVSAPSNATWRAAVQYVHTETTPWGVNENGHTYGVQNGAGTPDLVAVQTTDGRLGYAYAADLAAADPVGSSPEEAQKHQERRVPVHVPVYESDGVTLIGEFVIGS